MTIFITTNFMLLVVVYFQYINAILGLAHPLDTCMLHHNTKQSSKYKKVISHSAKKLANDTFYVTIYFVSLKALISPCRENPCSNDDVCYGNTGSHGSRRRCVHERTCGDTNNCRTILDGKPVKNSVSASSFILRTRRHIMIRRFYNKNM